MSKRDPIVIALYLPQYYETEYNNKWWEKGYTEWTAVRRSKPLFQGHYQPMMVEGLPRHLNIHMKNYDWSAPRGK